jgi:GNAT superfamily N-acetyltransferase
MLTIKLMTSHDFKFAATLTDTMNWNMTEDDFSFMSALEPHGSFILYSNAQPIGLATTITFDHVGWIGNVIVNHNFRHQGAGSLLVQHAIRYLETKEVTTVYIYAYPAKESFYQRLGFNKESNFIVLHGSPDRLPQTLTTIIPATETHHTPIIDFDYRCLGYSRHKLLSSLLSLSSTRGYLAIKNNIIQGYALIKDYNGLAELGPIVCTRETKKISSDLIYSALRDNSESDTFMCIPQNECALVNSLTSNGFQEDFRVVRMLRGFPLQIDCMQIAESLERG